MSIERYKIPFLEKNTFIEYWVLEFSTLGRNYY